MRAPRVAVVLWIGAADGFVAQSSRGGLTRLFSATTKEVSTAVGTVEWTSRDCDGEDPFQGQRIMISYVPTTDYFRGQELLWMGELRGEYTPGETDLNEGAVMTRPFQYDGESWVIDVMVPPACEQILFAVTDGVRFDTKDNEFYRIEPPWFLKPNEDKAEKPESQGPTFDLYRRLEDGNAEFLAKIRRRDASDLEDDVRREMARRQKEQEEAAMEEEEEEVLPEPVLNPEERVEASGLNDFEHPDISVSKHEQVAFQEMRARANDVGEALGLSNVQIGDVRMSFELCVADWKKSDSLLAKEKFTDFLIDLGFDDAVDNDRHIPLWDQYGSDDGMNLEDCIRVYYDLDSAGEGVDIL